MDPETADRLIELNQRFYQSFAGPFSESRRRIQPGVARLLAQIPKPATILDLGCGGGALAAALVREGHQGAYLGLDFSTGLLEEARRAVLKARQAKPGESAVELSFQQADLADAAWVNVLPPDPYDIILAFAVLHHLPGRELRIRLLSQVHAHLATGGEFLHSNWQFLNSERLRGRVQPWELAGITSEEVEPGDALLDWRRGGRGLRYVHHFDPQELQSLAQETGFAVRDSFYSDGEGGRLGLYQVWVPLKL